jgi:hypothetical protein
VSNIDRTADHSAEHTHQSAKHAPAHGLEHAQRDLERTIAALREPSLSKALRGSEELVKREFRDLNSLQLASHAQRDALRGALASVSPAQRPDAETRANDLVRQQERALNIARSDLQLRVLEARLGLESAVHRGTAVEELARAANLTAEAVTSASRREVLEINQQMRQALEDWRPSTDHRVKFDSSNAHIAVSHGSPGHVTVYATPGSTGDIHATLPNGSSVTATFYSTGDGHVRWETQIDGQLRQDRDHATTGTDHRRLHLNLETTVEKQQSQTQKDTIRSGSDGSLGLDAKAPLRGVVIDAEGAYRVTEANEGEHSRGSVRNEPAGSSKVGLSFEVKWTEPPQQNVTVYAGQKKEHRE